MAQDLGPEEAAPGHCGCGQLGSAQEGPGWNSGLGFLLLLGTSGACPGCRWGRQAGLRELGAGAAAASRGSLLSSPEPTCVSVGPVHGTDGTATQEPGCRVGSPSDGVAPSEVPLQLCPPIPTGPQDRSPHSARDRSAWCRPSLCCPACTHLCTLTLTAHSHILMCIHTSAHTHAHSHLHLCMCVCTLRQYSHSWPHMGTHSHIHAHTPAHTCTLILFTHTQRIVGTHAHTRSHSHSYSHTLAQPSLPALVSPQPLALPRAPAAAHTCPAHTCPAHTRTLVPSSCHRGRVPG